MNTGDRKIVRLRMRADHLVEALRRHRYIDFALGSHGFRAGQLDGPDVRVIDLRMEVGSPLDVLVFVEGDSLDETFRYDGTIKTVTVDLRPVAGLLGHLVPVGPFTTNCQETAKPQPKPSEDAADPLVIVTDEEKTVTGITGLRHGLSGRESPPPA